MFKKYKNIIIVTGIILIVLSVLLYIFYRQGKKTVTLQSLPGDLPGNTSSGNSNGASNEEINTLANELHTDMKGFNVWGHNYDPYNRAILLSNTDIVRLYNAFNALFQKDSGQTLTQWIASETYAQPGIPVSLRMRLEKLNAI